MSGTRREERLADLFDRLADRAAAPLIMGVLNVTPDSFSDGGAFVAPRGAVDRGLDMVAEGADVIDVGPESTRPGALPVPAAEQIDRAVPVIEGLRRGDPAVAISVDTQHAEVARAALAAGADLVNDISALRADPRTLRVAVEHRAGVVLMHMRGTPRTMQTAGGGPVYDDVVSEVGSFLRGRLEFAVEQGLPRNRILIDPGIGFGKTVRHNLDLLRHLPALAGLGVPLLVGASRKRFVGEVTGVEVAADRLAGSLVCVAVAVLGGAALLRVHDVAASRQAVLMAHALSPPPPAPPPH